jgi:putative transposase
MPRTARIVVSCVPHHVTQRGNRWQQVFFGLDDFARYMELIAEGCRDSRVEVLAWCLTPNHVHLVLVPEERLDWLRRCRPRISAIRG